MIDHFRAIIIGTIILSIIYAVFHPPTYILLGLFSWILISLIVNRIFHQHVLISSVATIPFYIGIGLMGLPPGLMQYIPDWMKLF